VTLTAALGPLLLFAVAPAVTGLANRTKSALTGRRGAPVLQGYADLAKLWRKGVVYSRTTTLLFRLAPVAAVATAAIAACLVPLDGVSSPVCFAGDLVAFAGLLALGRYLLVLGALDTGSSFEGMGASREVTIAAFAEPALLLCFTLLVVATGGMRLQDMLGGPLAHAWSAASPSLVLAAAALFMLSLAENCRVPVDDPLTHLELTMIHEVMILDHSGPDLALLQYAASLKTALLGAVVVRVFAAGFPLPPAVALAVMLPGLALYAAGIGVVESGVARLRMQKVPQLVAAAAAVAGFGLILLLR
jgi:formate hydrogenlyase subunit 4